MDWVKGGHKGVLIESQRSGETSFSEVARVTSTPWNDNRANKTAGMPEQRQYRLRYLKKDQPVGDYSDIYSVTTQP